MSGEIKPLSAQDLEPVIAIDTSIVGTSRRGFFEKRLAAALKQPGEYIYVGLHDAGKLVGYALARLVAGEFGQPGARASFDAVGVDPNHQGRGAGKQLLQAVEKVLAHKGVGELTSQVPWSETAMLGFSALSAAVVGITSRNWFGAVGGFAGGMMFWETVKPLVGLA